MWSSMWLHLLLSWMTGEPPLFRFFKEGGRARLRSRSFLVDSSTLFYNVNVKGTKNVIQICKSMNVKVGKKPSCLNTSI